MVETIKQNILNAINWFYQQLKERFLYPIVTMLMNGEVDGWLLDENGNVLSSEDDNGLILGLILKWKLYEHNMIADDFDISTPYKAGDYCVYDDTLYKFGEKKSAGEWDSSIVSRTNITSEIKEIFSAISEIKEEIASMKETNEESIEDINTLKSEIEKEQETIQELQNQIFDLNKAMDNKLELGDTAPADKSEVEENEIE